MASNKSINVFVSSAMLEMEYDREIVQETLRSMDINPILFEVLPAMNQSPSDSYLDEVRECDIFVMLLWKSLRPAVLDEYIHAVKWNKPILILVKSLAGDEERDPKLRDFLSDLTNGSSRHPVRRATYKSYRRIAELREALQSSVSAEMSKFYKEPIQTISREEMYELGTSIIRPAQKRLYLFQKTPSIILGARDYLAADHAKYAHEKELTDALLEWIRENYQAPDREFLYIFSAEATRQELDRHGLHAHQDYIDGLKQRIAELDDLENDSGHRFRVRSVDLPISGPLIVGDNRFALWLLGGEDAVSFSQESEKICDILVRMLRARVQGPLCTDELLSALGIQ